MAPAGGAIAAAQVGGYWLPRPLLLTLGAVLAIFATGGQSAQIILIAYGIVAVWMALSSPVEGVAMVIMVSAIDGISKGVMPGWYTLLMKDVVLWCCMLRWAAARLMRRPSSAVRTRTFLWIALFVGWVLVEAGNTTTRSVLIALAGVRSWIGWIPIFLVAYDDLHPRRDGLRLMITFVVAAALAGLYGIVQQQIGYDHLLAISHNFRYVYRLGIEEGVYRSISTLPHPGIFGHFMATMLPMAIALSMAPFLPPWARWLCLVSAAFIAGGAVSSGARLAAAAALSTLALMIIVARQARGLILGVVLVGIIGYAGLRLAAPEAAERMGYLFNTKLTLARMRTPLQRGWNAAVEHPLGLGVATGVAVGRAWQFLSGSQETVIAREARGMVEGDYGRAFREMGILGGLLLLCLVAHVVSSGLKALNDTKPLSWRYYSAGLIAILLSEALALLVGPAFYLMPVAALFWIASALLQRLAADERSVAAERPPAGIAATAA
jgi:hypothetical protein